jgi:hypothetical protein
VGDEVDSVKYSVDDDEIVDDVVATVDVTVNSDDTLKDSVCDEVDSVKYSVDADKVAVDVAVDSVDDVADSIEDSVDDVKDSVVDVAYSVDADEVAVDVVVDSVDDVKDSVVDDADSVDDVEKSVVGVADSVDDVKDSVNADEVAVDVVADSVNEVEDLVDDVGVKGGVEVVSDVEGFCVRSLCAPFTSSSVENVEVVADVVVVVVIFGKYGSGLVSLRQSMNVGLLSEDKRCEASKSNSWMKIPPRPLLSEYAVFLFTLSAVSTKYVSV